MLTLAQAFREEIDAHHAHIPTEQHCLGILLTAANSSQMFGRTIEVGREPNKCTPFMTNSMT